MKIKKASPITKTPAAKTGVRVYRSDSARLAHIGNGDGVGAGVGRDHAAQLKHAQRLLAEGLLAGAAQVLGLLDAGVADHVFKIFHAGSLFLAQVHHGGDDLVIAADLALDDGLAVDQADDGTQAQQFPRKGGGSRNAAALLHLAEAVGSQDDLHLVHLDFKFVEDVAQLGAVAQFAGQLADVPAEHHRIGVAVQQVNPHLVLGALFPEHPLGDDGVVIGGGAAAVDADVDHVGVAGVHIFTVLLTELDGGDGCGGRHALGLAHQSVEFLVVAAHPLQVIGAVQQDVEAHDVDAVLVGQRLGDVARGVGQDRDFVHSNPHFHS